MRLDNIKVVARREYLQRIRSKGFWISTILFPAFAVVMTVLPSLLLMRARTTNEIILVDETGRVGTELINQKPEPEESVKEQNNERLARINFHLEPVQPDHAAQEADLRRRVLNKEADAWIWVGPKALTGGPVEYHGRSTSNFMTQGSLEHRLTDAVRRVRLTDAGLDPDRISALSARVPLKTIRVSAEGSHAEGGAGGFFFAYILFFMLFLALLIWGQQVMNGILEEKSSRVIEVVVSSVKPFELMMGKLTGICLVGLTQISLWLATMIVISTPGLIGSSGSMPDELQIPRFTATMAVHFVGFFVLGFFIYSSFYAALGSAFNSLQEAQQVASTMGIVFAIPAILMPMVINSPSSTLAVVTSLIPLFTPVLMPLRVVTEMPPAWQILLGYVLTAGFLLFMVWLCSRIYRIGILMYGKKPTIPELLRWVRYS